jgi:hypothetical protein
LNDLSRALSKSETTKPRVQNLDKFDRNKPSCLETTDTALIVARARTGQLNLYQLTNKSDGLCDIQQLGRNKLFFRNSMAWYREFVAGPRITNVQGQMKQNKDRVKAYVEDFFETKRKRESLPYRR